MSKELAVQRVNKIFNGLYQSGHGLATPKTLVKDFIDEHVRHGKNNLSLDKLIMGKGIEESTPQGKGKVVGKMLPGSRALIIEKDSEDYKVQNPYDQSIGWVNEVQVNRTLFQDTATRKPCTK